MQTTGVLEELHWRGLVSQHTDGVRDYYNHLERLGLTEEDLVAYALVLGRTAEPGS